METARLITAVRLPFVSAFALALVFPPVRAAAQNQGDDVKQSLESAAQQLQAGEPKSALEKLEPVETAEPGNPWLWFYGGLAHQQLGNWYQAMERYDRAQDLLLAYGDPDPQLAERIRQYRARARKQVVGLSIQMGVLYDSNVTFLGSGGAGFLISGRGDGKFASKFQFAYAPIATDEESLSFSAWAINNWNFSIEQFNDQDYGGSARYTRRLTDRWEAALQYDYDIIYLDNQPYLSNHTLTPSLSYDWFSADARLAPVDTTFFYRFEARDFLFTVPSEFDRDGFANAVGVRQTFAWQPDAGSDWACDIRAGYTFDSVATEGTEFDRLEHLFYLGFAFPFHNPLVPHYDPVVRMNLSWVIADYREDSLTDADNDQRADLITSADAVISQPLMRDAETGDLTLHLIVGYSDANSNVTLEDGGTPFSYDKWIAGFQFEWSW